MHSTSDYHHFMVSPTIVWPTRTPNPLIWSFVHHHSCLLFHPHPAYFPGPVIIITSFPCSRERGLSLQHIHLAKPQNWLNSSLHFCACRAEQAGEKHFKCTSTASVGSLILLRIHVILPLSIHSPLLLDGCCTDAPLSSERWHLLLCLHSQLMALLPTTRILES